MDVVTLYLKNGQNIEVVCEEWKVEIDSFGAIVSYEFKGVNNYKNLSIDLDEIVAYTAKKYEGEEK